MDPTAAYFETRLPRDARRARIWAYLARYLGRYIPEGARILELGAGYCYFINAVRGSRRVAVDIAEIVIECAAPGVEAVRADALDYLGRTDAGEFDFVLASNFLEHLDWTALDRLAPLLLHGLRPGGRLALIQPNFRLVPRRYFDDYTHRTIFTDVSLADWLGARGFRLIEVVPRFLPLTVKGRLGHLDLLLPLYLRLPWRPLAGQMFVLAERS